MIESTPAISHSLSTASCPDGRFFLQLIEEIMIGEDKLIHFIGVDKPEACTIVLRGAR